MKPEQQLLQQWDTGLVAQGLQLTAVGHFWPKFEAGTAC